MRIRSTLAGLALGAGALLLSAPAALADTGSAPQPSVSSNTARPSAVPARPTARPAATISGQVVKPRGAAETGGGMEEPTSNAGVLVIGGVALVAVAGGGAVAYRRFRKQS